MQRAAVHRRCGTDRPIRILVGFAAGGPADITARLIGDRLSEAWGKPVIVENVTGAAGNVATERVAKAAPDGYTLLAAASATIVTNPSLYQKLPFDPVKDLAPITQAAYTPNILALPNDVPARSVQELVAYARANPGKLSFGSAGVGTSQISRASCSRPWPASTSSTCPIAASRR